MKIFSTLVVLVQLAMLGSVAQAAFPSSDSLVHLSTRQLVQELETRMLDKKRDPSNGSSMRRSIPYNEYVDFTRRAAGTGATSVDAGAAGADAAPVVDTSGTGGATSAGGGAPTDLSAGSTTPSPDMQQPPPTHDQSHGSSHSHHGKHKKSKGIMGTLRKLGIVKRS